MHSEARLKQMIAVKAHPLAELLECPAATGDLLNRSSRFIEVETGDVIFRQFEMCRGLYLIVSGQFTRKAERLQTRLILGTVRAGDLVELAAAIGSCQHTFTLSALTDGSVMLLPIEALVHAFESYAPLRMRLLEELAREVSRAYNSCSEDRFTRLRRRSPGTLSRDDKSSGK